MGNTVSENTCEVLASLLLEGFALPVHEFDLCENIRLRPANARELRTLVKEDRFAAIEPARVSALEGRFDFAGSLPHLGDFQEMERHMEKAALAMRLLLPGTLGWQMTCFASPQQEAIKVFVASTHKGVNALGEGSVEVRMEQLEEVAKLWVVGRPVLLTLEKWPRLRIALGRFSDSYRRRSSADKLIDLAICLEALLGERTEHKKSELLADRASHLLSIREDGCGAVAVVRRIYSMRNAVVHGEELGCASGELLSCKDLVRSCLRQYLRIAIEEGSQEATHARISAM